MTAAPASLGAHDPLARCVGTWPRGTAPRNPPREVGGPGIARDYRVRGSRADCLSPSRLQRLAEVDVKLETPDLRPIAGDRALLIRVG